TPPPPTPPAPPPPRDTAGASDPRRGRAGPPPPPPHGWKPADVERAAFYQADPEVLNLVNAAIYLRRPLLVTGKPGVGKSTLALAVAYELGLGPVLRWPITSRTTLQDGLYKYDAISRLHDVSLNRREDEVDIGRYITLGPLGTALLPCRRPRALLIDEIDKGDIDLPNDLLTVFEAGDYQVPELVRAAGNQPTVHVSTADGAASVPVERGHVRCRAFPVIVLTSNGEREFPPAFLRRCIIVEISPPDRRRLAQIVRARLGDEISASATDLVDRFIERQKYGDLATDQLLNAIYLTFHAAREDGRGREELADQLLQYLRSPSAQT
ncbi:AAA family ATPase, partial [Streptomyces sp. NPDC059096]|uniref:AAA family ATPase n=1 Tax=Streptomyces sp. NPDC059096 TaxID=3346727 RepID=UPI0036AAC265